MSIEWPAINSSRTFPSVLGLRRAAGLALSTLLASGLVGGLFAGSAFATTAARGHSGSVDVLYAGSFLDLMQQQLAPAFHKATGYTVSGFSDGSSALASEIKGGTEVGDVFISASPTVNATLEGCLLYTSGFATRTVLRLRSATLILMTRRGAVPLRQILDPGTTEPRRDRNESQVAIRLVQWVKGR